MRTAPCKFLDRHHNQPEGPSRCDRRILRRHANGWASGEALKIFVRVPLPQPVEHLLIHAGIAVAADPLKQVGLSAERLERLVQFSSDLGLDVVFRLTSHVVGDTQILSEGRYLVRLAVTINYQRKDGQAPVAPKAVCG